MMGGSHPRTHDARQWWRQQTIDVSTCPRARARQRFKRDHPMVNGWLWRKAFYQGRDAYFNCSFFCKITTIVSPLVDNETCKLGFMVLDYIFTICTFDLFQFVKIRNDARPVGRLSSAWCQYWDIIGFSHAGPGRRLSPLEKPSFLLNYKSLFFNFCFWKSFKNIFFLSFFFCIKNRPLNVGIDPSNFLQNGTRQYFSGQKRTT